MAGEVSKGSHRRAAGGLRKSKPKALSRRVASHCPVQCVDERARGLTASRALSTSLGTLFAGVPMATAAAAEDNQPAHRFAKDRLKAFVERVEKLEEEKKAISDDVRDVYAEAKANGYDIKALRKMDINERKEQEAVLETYMHALGMLS